MGPQRQVHAKHKAVFGGVANQGVDGFDGFAKVFVVADLSATIGQPLGFPFVLVDINEVNVAGDIQLASSQFAHANNPQRNGQAFRAERRAIAGVQLLASLQAGAVECQLCQSGHTPGDDG